MKILNPHATAAFQAYITRFYQNYGRHDLPWRRDYEPYQVMVSESMLQQTQVERVIPKFEAFLATFPTIDALAAAPVAQVIQAWQGLGYNRRGLNLQRAAQAIVANHQGKIPQSLEELTALPGIGPYTAAAIQAFAFNQPSIVIETNIRTVYLFHFFPETYGITDAELQPLLDSTLDKAHPRQWYSALMDYGTYLKKVLPNPSRRSAAHTKQSKFQGSRRQLRGQILKQLASQPQLSSHNLHTLVADTVPPESLEHLSSVLDQLASEGFITQESTGWRLSS